jgi:hypothetical protein
MEQKVQIRIPNPQTQSAEVHSFADLDNARDFLTRRIREEAKKVKQKAEKVDDVPGE